MSGVVTGYVGRFAPSPTGPLHAGSLVAALASWLDARAHGGRWLVRIEDVDTPRCMPGAAETLLGQLAACGLVADEPPVWQSARGDRYERALARLRRSGWVYPCFCSRSAIAAALARAGSPHVPHGELVYPGTCRPPYWEPADERPVRGRAAWRVRTRDAQGRDIEIGWNDRRLGPQRQDIAAEVGDFVLRRADGVWAYQLAVVVDDAEQGVTDIVRGEDLADNTARQIHLQRVLGLPTPRYLHTPLVFAADGQKLSKQTGARALACRTEDEALAALHEAAGVLGLPRAVSTRRDAPRTTSEWLGRAVRAWTVRYTGVPGSAVHPGVAAQDTGPRR